MRFKVGDKVVYPSQGVSVVEEISKEAHTLVLRTPDGVRQTIHYDTETVVFDTGAGPAPTSPPSPRPAPLHRPRTP